MATWAWFLTVVVASGILMLLFVRRVRRRRREHWQAQMRTICVEVAALRTELSRLLQLVPERSHWGDDGWSDGERKAEELSRSLEQLGTRAPKAARETFWTVVASLRALVIAIGVDPFERAQPARAGIIRRRLRDLGPTARSLETAGLERPGLRRRGRIRSGLLRVGRLET